MSNISFANIPIVSNVTMYFRRKDQQFVDIIEIIISVTAFEEQKRRLHGTV